MFLDLFPGAIWVLATAVVVDVISSIIRLEIIRRTFPSARLDRFSLAGSVVYGILYLAVGVLALYSSPSDALERVMIAICIIMAITNLKPLFSYLLNEHHYEILSWSIMFGQVAGIGYILRAFFGGVFS